MEQTKLRERFEATHPDGKTNANLTEFEKKLAAIIGGLNFGEFQCLKNERTGEVYYTRVNKRKE